MWTAFSARLSPRRMPIRGLLGTHFADEPEMRTAFAGVDSSGGEGEPTARDRAFIGKLIESHRSGKRRA